MARLLINPNSPAAWEIQLKPGTNLLGRGFANDFKITDPSVSGSHCQIVVEGGQFVIKDLGSTNGTFVNRAPVKEAALSDKQTIHLGSVEMAFFSDLPGGIVGFVPPPSAPSAIPIAPSAAVPMAVPLPPPPSASPSPTIHLSPPTAAPPLPRPAGLSVSARPGAPAATAFAAPPAAAPPIPAAIPGIPGMGGAVSAPAGQKCKFHPKTAARYYCNKCRKFFCELCITTRQVHEVMQKTCRACGVEVAPVTVQLDRPDKISFYSRIPGAFSYPFKGSGPFVLVVCSIASFGLGFLGRGWISIFATTAYYGYMFAFMQNIIHSTASADEELPGWPGIDDLGGCFIRFLGAALISFAVPIGLTIMALFSDESTIGSTLLIPGWIFGALYFPMALLAVAMKDTPIAANPLIVVPGIFKAPLEYLVTVVLMAIILGLYNSGDDVIGAIFPRGLTTHRMDRLFGYLGCKAIWFFFQLYLLAVNMRILGLLYLTKKRKLAWFEH
jgi:hypothetical protein